ncbi:MAG: hypothetical protein WA090_07465 [Candidatus Nanopelagicaceae bacterium]
MAILFALSLPGLVLILIGLGVFQLLHSKATGSRRPGAGSVGIDLFDTVLKPGSEHRLLERESRKLTREESEEGAPAFDQELKAIVIKVKK